MFSDLFMKFLMEYKSDDKKEIEEDMSSDRKELFDSQLFAKRQPVIIPVYFLESK